MQNNRRHIIILYCVLAVTFSAVGFGMIRKEKTESPTKKENNDNRFFFWEIYPELVVPNSGRLVDSKLEIKNLDDVNVSVRSLVKEKPILVFRYSRYDCQLCVNQVLDKLRNIFRDEEHRVCLIVDGMSERDFKIKYKNSEIKFLAYFVENKNLGLSLENKNLPFLFVLTTGTKVEQIFIPFKEYPNQTDAYLRNVKSNLGD